MLPTHGAASGVFLLANAANHINHEDVGAWTLAARARSSFLAGALNLDGCAAAILRLGLAKVAGTVQLDPALSALSEKADRPTLVAISSLLLASDPPSWISLAVHDGLVFREYIPTDDLRGLEWLEPDLDQLLAGVAEDMAGRHVDSLREALGRAGELVILAAAADAGFLPLHVADVSDSFGYDIEVHIPSKLRFEVKSTTSTRQGIFHLSRNEFDKCRHYGDEWRLIQVTFDSAIFSDNSISASHISAIRELYSRELIDLVPPDSNAFRWTESSLIQPPIDAWRLSQLRVPATLRLPGVRDLMKQRK